MTCPRGLPVLVALAALCTSLFVVTVRADVGLDVAWPLRGVPLGARMTWLEDTSGTATLESVQQPGLAARFVAAPNDAPGFGFTRSATWVRLVVKNTASVPRPWLLELGYPHLDEVTLYVPDEAVGYRARETGDARPFSSRDLSFRNFVFTLEEPAGGERVYYLRVATTGSLSLPLKAWTLTEFTEHEYLDWAGLCIFYGILTMMAAYHLALFAFTGDREALRFALLVLSMGAFQMTAVGHTFQFLFPTNNELAQVAMPVSIALCMFFTAVFGRYQLDDVVASTRDRRIMTQLVYAAFVVLWIAALAPYRLTIRLVPACCVVGDAIAFTMLWRVLRDNGARATLNVSGWSSMCLGAVIMFLRLVGLVPDNFFTNWSVQIGASVCFVCLSGGMASKLTWLRRELSSATEALGTQVRALEDAVARAEGATAQAARAARVKDEFIAALSHELRTPLNAIINVPQGLVSEFPLRRYAICDQCKSCFELEAGEPLSSHESCPECFYVGTLRLHEVASYAGDPLRTTRYLETIERSGMHLLRVVDGILRFEDTPDNDREPITQLDYSEVAPDDLAREVVEELSAGALRAGIELTLAIEPGVSPLVLDPLRIRQVLLNLVGNAIKFSPRDSHVRVVVAPDGHEGGCVLVVRDQGIGIAPDKLESVFDSYQQGHDTVDKRYEGTGLGLSISRAFVLQHGGSLSVESELGRGATFVVRLPGAVQQRSA